MNQAGVDRLTPSERRCLHGVLTERTAKRIAISLGISEATVNTHLRHAREKLEVSTSYDAAKLLEASEMPPQISITQSMAMVGDPARQQVWSGNSQSERERERQSVREDRTPFAVDDRIQRNPDMLGRPNTLPIWTRLLSIAAMVAILMIVVVLIPQFYSGMQDWANIILNNAQDAGATRPR
jgi:DNA-binding CsgD family transcriptional regulator